MAKHKEESGECPFCGKWGVITADHIPPKSLFPNPRPDNMIIVPACKECNTGSSNDDEIFRTAMAVDIRSSQNVDSLIPKALRGMKRKYSLFVEAMKTAQEVELQSSKGLFIGNGYRMQIDSKPMNRVITKIIKGLIYHHTKEYDKRFEMKYIELSDDFSKFDQELMKKVFVDYDFHGNIGNVFSYSGTRIDIAWIWRMTFYEYRHFIGIATIPKEHLSKAELECYGECYSLSEPERG